jgi:multiple sugar transport system permease protein
MFLSPWLLGFLLFTMGPLAASLLLSFTDFHLTGAPHWVGAANYAHMLDDPRYAASVSVTLVYVALSVPASLLAALAVALLLNQDLRGMSVYRAVYYLPSLMAGSVAIAIVWRKVFGGGGAADLLLRALGIAGPDGISLVDGVHTALYTLVLLNVWQFGAPMVIFLAGLQQIPKEYYEAAQVDGAGAVRRFFFVTLPLLTPVIFFNLVLGVIGGFQTFTNAYVVSGGDGGPVNATLFYSLYLYQEAFRGFRMGYASAMAWSLLAAIAVATGVLFWTQRRWVHYGDEIR